MTRSRGSRYAPVVGLRSLDDPIRDVIGSGKYSHPDEWNMLLSNLKKAGVEVRMTPGRSAMSYFPKRGQPGQLILDPDASISALRHEYGHYLDDFKLGYPGLGYYMNNPTAQWTLEFNSYIGEIKFARELGDKTAAKQLLINARKEKNTIFNPTYIE